MSLQIEFIDIWGDTPDEYYPVPGVTELPEWYKKAGSFIDGQPVPDKRKNPNDSITGTIKRCKPVLDSLSSGYLLKLPVDVNVRWDEEHGHWFEWPTKTAISWHPVEQVPGYPGQQNRRNPYPKFGNPWVIKTPPGYSTFFMTPVHRGLPFHILEGVVDTDTYHNTVLFPFVFHDPKFEGLLEAGTPMVQVFPFKRDSWKMTARQATPADLRTQGKVAQFIGSTFGGVYAKSFWARKEYR